MSLPGSPDLAPFREQQCSPPTPDSSSMLSHRSTLLGQAMGLKIDFTELIIFYWQNKNTKKKINIMYIIESNIMKKYARSVHKV